MCDGGQIFGSPKSSQQEMREVSRYPASICIHLHPSGLEKLQIRETKAGKDTEWSSSIHDERHRIRLPWFNIWDWHRCEMAQIRLRSTWLRWIWMDMDGYGWIWVNVYGILEPQVCVIFSLQYPAMRSFILFVGSSVSLRSKHNRSSGQWTDTLHDFERPRDLATRLPNGIRYFEVKERGPSEICDFSSCTIFPNWEFKTLRLHCHILVESWRWDTRIAYTTFFSGKTRASWYSEMTRQWGSSY